MCGRFALKNPDAMRAAFGLGEIPQMPPRYNIAPTQDVAIVRVDPSGRRLALAHWGLIPYWAPDAKGAYSTINARAETVDVKPAFREAFHHQRCLIPADGFYEWRSEGGVKMPHLVARQDGAPFAFAGLWDVWRGPAGEVLSCSVIVTDANAVVRPLHDRMPVILSPADYARWLDPAYHDTESLKALLVAAPDDLLVEHPVSPSINNPKNEWPQFSSKGPQP
jgi:putative SOS response-associated peptidase YedK